MTLDEQIQEVITDIDVIKRLIDQSTRPRIKQNLELQRHNFETELIQFQEKLQKQQQQADLLAAEKVSSASSLPTATQSYTKDISVYAWDQTDKFVKIYVQNLDGVGNLPENQIQCSFEKKGFHLQIQNLKNINYSLKRTRLLHDIEPEQSSFKVKKDMVIVSLRKVASTNWECFLQDEKKTPIKPLPKLDNLKEGSNESFMNVVEEMYENGDDDTKRAIAKAWVQSREKANAVANQQHDTNPGIIKTSDFTFYPPPKNSS